MFLSCCSSESEEAFCGIDLHLAGGVEEERHVEVGMSGREIKPNGIIVWLYHFSDTFIYRIRHTRVFLIVRELPHNESANAT